MMREVVFDTETTGFGVEEHRVVEIGAVELVNRVPTGKTFQVYLNPEREIDWSAVKVHGITNEKVRDCLKFVDVVDDWLAFVGEATLVAHNADFDMSFMGMELVRAGRPRHTNPVVDTVALARKKIPGQGRYNLDALCRFYGVDLSARTYHGALLDAQLLAEVYVELMGGLQASFGLEPVVVVREEVQVEAAAAHTDDWPVVAPTAEEVAAHGEFLGKYVKEHKWG